jgi:LacI family transcriptional regulator
MRKSSRGSNSSGPAVKRTARRTDPSKSAGIKEIATAAGVSIGTVDRALHGRAEINEGTRARIMKIAEQLGYRPNLSARFLKLGSRRKIVVHLPQEIASYFDPVRSGILKAAEELQPRLDVEIHSYPRLGSGEAESIERLIEAPCDGLIIAPSSPGSAGPLIREASRRGIPVVCVATDAPGSDRLAAVSTDSFTSGAIAAELFTRLLKRGGQTAIVTGDLATFDHSEKVRGFRAMLAELNSPVKLSAVSEAHDDYGQARNQTRDLLSRQRHLAGIYVSTSNSLGVIQELEDSQRLGGVDLVTTDLFPELVPLLRSGKVFATLYQQPFTQGRMAFEALHRFIVEGIRPRSVCRLPPYIVLRSNIDSFLGNSPEAPAGQPRLLLG